MSDDGPIYPAIDAGDLAPESGDSARVELDVYFTSAVRDRLLQGLGDGMSLAVAARYAGVPENNLRQWVRWGTQNHAPYAEWLEVVNRTRAEGISVVLREVHKHAKDNPAAARWLLEKLDPVGFGEAPTSLEQQAHQGMTSDELVRELARMPAVQDEVRKLKGGGE